MAVALNSRHRLCPRRLLKQDDAEIKAYFVRTRDNENGRPINKSLIRLHHAQEDSNVTDEEALENFFYGHFGDFTPSEPFRPVPIDYWYTERFLALSNQELHWPYYSDMRIGLAPKELKRPKEVLADCATNYLLKNFWHNYVHNKIQGITHDNYRKFGGGARNDSDFEADNLATLFLIHSYGLPVTAEGIIKPATHKKIVYLLRRNRCNRVFAQRDAIRESKARRVNPCEKNDQLEWLYRRALSNYLSGWMAAHGYAVTSIGVFLVQSSGRLTAPSDLRVVVELNRTRYTTEMWPLLKTGKKRRAHFREIAMRVSRNYVNKLADNPTLRAYACESLSALFNRAGIWYPELENRGKKFAERPKDIVQHLAETLVVD